MKAPQWLADAWDNVATVTRLAWGALPQGARDFLKGAFWGSLVTFLATLALLWGRV